MTRIHRPLHAVLIGLVAVFAAAASLAGIADVLPGERSAVAVGGGAAASGA